MIGLVESLLKVWIDGCWAGLLMCLTGGRRCCGTWGPPGLWVAVALSLWVLVSSAVINWECAATGCCWPGMSISLHFAPFCWGCTRTMIGLVESLLKVWIDGCWAGLLMCLTGGRRCCGTWGPPGLWVAVALSLWVLVSSANKVGSQVFNTLITL